MDTKDFPVHTIVGGLTTDYFGFYCERCKERIDPLEFLGLVYHTPTFKLHCFKCNETFVFKMEILKGRKFMKDHDAQEQERQGPFSNERIALLGSLGALSGYLAMPTSIPWGIFIIAQGIILTGVAVLVRPHIIKRTLPESSGRYAQSAWLSFLEVTNPEAKPT